MILHGDMDMDDMEMMMGGDMMGMMGMMGDMGGLSRPGLKRHGHAHSAADAERGEPAGDFAAADAQGQVRNDARAAGADGVAKRDGAAVWVHAGIVH